MREDGGGVDEDVDAAEGLMVASSAELDGRAVGCR
jgi:hypothetical protein